MAHRGADTLRFGPMKPVGLVDPRTGRAPYAAVQLRQDNLAGDHYSLVGFQTQLKWGEQARVLRLIPGLEQAEFVRFGMVHRNTYVNGPTVLADTWQVRARPTLFFAGQMSGVEGYVESAASGLLAGLNAAALAAGRPASAPPRTTAIGALAYYVSHANPAHYEPSNITFGIMPPLERARREEQARAEAGDLPSARWPISRTWMHDTHISKRSCSFSGLTATPRRTRCAPTRAICRSFSITSRRARGHHARPTLEPAHLDRAAIRGFLAELHKRGQSRASAARKLAAARTFLRYLRREGLIDDDPGALVPTPKREVRMPVHLSEERWPRLIDGAGRRRRRSAAATARFSSCSTRRACG